LIEKAIVLLTIRHPEILKFFDLDGNTDAAKSLSHNSTNERIGMYCDDTHTFIDLM
jgi:hypothetical protein